MLFRSKLAVFFFACVLSIGYAQAAVQFKIATASPDGSFWMQKMRAAGDEIEKRTEKRVVFKFYPGGVMGDDSAVLYKIRLGQLHGAAVTNGSLNVVYPDVQLYNMVMKFNSLEEVDLVREKMDRVIMNGLEANGMATIGLAEIGFAYLMSMQPLHNVRDLRTQKAWVPEGNFIAEAALNAFSVAPIPLPIRDVFVGLQTGMVNVVAGSPVGAIALQWHTQVKYMIDLPMAYIYGIFAIDNKAFARISSQDQRIVREIMGQAVQEIDKGNRRDNVGAFNAILKQGVQLIKLDVASTKEMAALVASANDNLVKAGKMNPSNVVEMEKYLQEYRAGKH